MRTLTLIPLALLTSACWTPGPGQIDPSLDPVDVRAQLVRTSEHGHAPPIVARGAISPDPGWQPKPGPLTPETSYCIMAIEQERNSGITVGGNGVMACTAPPGRR